MESHHPHDHRERESVHDQLSAEQESVRDQLIRALELLVPKSAKRPVGQSPLCLSVQDLKKLATCEPALPEQSYHLRHCRPCRVALAAIQDELRSAGPDDDREDMPAAASGAFSMAMPEGGVAREMLVVPVLSAIRNAIADTEARDWSLQGSWALLEYLKKYARDIAFVDSFRRRQLAAEYADLVESASETMKVVLVYGLIRMKEARHFAMCVAREIAGRDDVLARRVVVFMLHTEAAELKFIDHERWEEIAGAADPEIQCYRTRVDDALARFEASIKPPRTLTDAVAVLRADVLQFATAMFTALDAPAVILHLLAMREYLGRIAMYVHETHSELIERFPALVGDIYDCAREHGAALLLAMEASEKLRPACPVETMIQALIDFERLPAISRQEPKARAESC